MLSLSIQPLAAIDIDDIVSSFKAIGWNKLRHQYEEYLAEQAQGARTIFVARSNGTFLGYSTIVWHSEYEAFAQKNIPEIKDLNVLPDFRKQGVGRSLMTICEDIARSHKYKKLGLGVGLLPDYGSAQRLYFNLSYIPDGAGLHYGNRPVSYGQNVSADDELVLYLSKELQTSQSLRLKVASYCLEPFSYARITSSPFEIFYLFPK